MRNIKKINDSYLNHISNIHTLKLKLNSKRNELELKNSEKENLITEEQKAIEENDFEKADHIETSIKKLSEKIVIMILIKIKTKILLKKKENKI